MPPGQDQSCDGRHALRLVLIIEDDDGVRRVASRMLEREGCRVVLASGAEEGLAMAYALDGDLDVLVTDLILPGKDTGLSIVRRIRERHPDVRCVIMSGWGEAVDKLDGVGGDFVFLEKPITGPDLLRAVLGESHGNPERARAEARGGPSHT